MSHDENCVFCRIIAGKLPCERLAEDGEFICIRDVYPQSKMHLLVMPRGHLASLPDAFADPVTGTMLLGKMFAFAMPLVRQHFPGGFRTVINTGSQAGQTVHHLHLHLLGGEKLNAKFGA